MEKKVAKLQKEETTVRLNHKTKQELDIFRVHKHETYDEIIRKLIHIAKTCEKKPKSALRILEEINEAREKVRDEGFYREEEVKKILGS